MKKLFIPFVALATVLRFSPYLQAHNLPGVESPLQAFQSGDGENCYVYKDYVVLSAQAGHEVGSDTVVLKKEGSTPKQFCQPSPEKLILDVKNQEAEYFMGLWRQFLFLYSGRNELVGNLMIYDLSAKKKLSEVNVAQPFELKKEGVLVFYTADDFNLEAKQCPLGPEGTVNGFEVEMNLNLKTLKLTPTGQNRCTSRPAFQSPGPRSRS